MKIIDALKHECGTLIIQRLGSPKNDKWLYYDTIFKKWVVRQQLKVDPVCENFRCSTIETADEDLAVEKLLED